MSQSNVIAAFSRAAQSYDEYARVQMQAGDALCAWLPVRDVQHILDLGCGTGAFTKKVAHRYPLAKVTAVDASITMAAQADRACDGLNVTVHQGDARTFAGEPPYDLIVSNASLHWFCGEPFFRHAADILADKGEIVFSAYGSKTFHELATALRAIGSAQEVIAETFADAEDLADAMCGAFTDVTVETVMYEERFTDVTEMFRSMRGSGIVPSKSGAPWTRSRLAALQLAFEERGGVTLSHEVIFGYGRKT
jgi:malonyl-CoA O-methyltransferase